MGTLFGMLFYCLLIVPAFTLADRKNVTCNGGTVWVDDKWKTDTKAALQKVCGTINQNLTYSPMLDCILQLEWVNKSSQYHSLVQHWYPHQANIRDIPKENAFQLMAALRHQARRWFKDLLCASARMVRKPNNSYYACATYDRDYRKFGWGIQHKFACVFYDKESEK